MIPLKVSIVENEEMVFMDSSVVISTVIFVRYLVAISSDSSTEPRSDVPGRGANGPGLKMDGPGPEHLILWAWAVSFQML